MFGKFWNWFVILGIVVVMIELLSVMRKMFRYRVVIMVVSLIFVGYFLLFFFVLEGLSFLLLVWEMVVGCLVRMLCVFLLLVVDVVIFGCLEIFFVVLVEELVLMFVLFLELEIFLLFDMFLEFGVMVGVCDLVVSLFVVGLFSELLVMV